MDIGVITTIGGVLGGLGALAWGVISGFKRRAKIAQAAYEKAQGDVEQARGDLVQVITLEADAWKKRYEGEHAEYVDYRKKNHDLDQDKNALLLRLTTENAELKGKTDLSPVLQFQKEQSEINTKLVRSLDAILSRMGISDPLPGHPLL